MRSEYQHDRSAEIAFHLRRGPVILSGGEAGFAFPGNGWLNKPLATGAVLMGVRLDSIEWLDLNRVKLNPTRLYV